MSKYSQNICTICIAWNFPGQMSEDVFMSFARSYVTVRQTFLCQSWFRWFDLSESVSEESALVGVHLWLQATDRKHDVRICQNMLYIIYTVCQKICQDWCLSICQDKCHEVAGIDVSICARTSAKKKLPHIYMLTYMKVFWSIDVYQREFILQPSFFIQVSLGNFAGTNSITQVAWLVRVLTHAPQWLAALVAKHYVSQMWLERSRRKGLCSRGSVWKGPWTSPHCVMYAAGTVANLVHLPCYATSQPGCSKRSCCATKMCGLAGASLLCGICRWLLQNALNLLRRRSTFAAMRISCSAKRQVFIARHAGASAPHINFGHHDHHETLVPCRNGSGCC